ncbi:dihydroorotate dehydrogenase electron transfer subunit [Clostridium tetani]|uniref:Dihydroorotate dehydrogenase electron transfer subunit n=1 Tax=Clostridium tetani TaxID=1513 RepID=A0ABY0ENS2_CLOTA|nr:dihydroorotate dehydrogenase electron transfer subunit [Clostridium tetani]RXI55350.1 dihydroorotate dehydrogenase electron transfer subunit [Clostridium tetani]RXI68421.1 dihydroorotate dehydrogenase electron transfer subunit [Clostridium tetani]
MEENNLSKIIYNKQLSKDFYIMKIEGNFNGEMGQFCMLRAWDKYPTLSRPISIYDIDHEGITFLYKVVGKGTEIFATLQKGDEIKVDGPYGNRFPKVKGKVALVGGGVGIAPLYLASKVLKETNKDTTVDIFLGFSDEALLEEEYKKVADKVVVNVGGFITDDINPEDYDYIFTCGPEVMMKALYNKSKNSKAKLYVSMENRMACGVGVCLVCTCKTKKGNKRACKEGPVFLGEDVF